jgi:hypothetical protein
LRTTLRTTALVLAAAGSAAAHERDFTLSRDWHLPYPGEFEVESRSFWGTHSHDFTQMFELEYGISKHFAIEPGVSFVKVDGDSVDYDAFDTELRFNLFDFELGKILPALNVEYEHPDSSEEPDMGELKLILTRYDVDGQDLTVNFNVGQELENGGKTENEITAGYVHGIGPIGEGGPQPGEVKAGVEFIHQFDDVHTGLGPLVTYKVSEHLHVLGAFVVALNDRPDNEDQVRVIVEWEF